MISDTLLDLRNEAKKRAKDLPVTAFYLDHATEVSYAWELFFDHPLMRRLQDDCLTFLYDDAMFGIEHSKKVAQEAAAIVMAEDAGLETDRKKHLALLASIAGMLHDLQRGEDDHAHRSAEAVPDLLKGYPLTAEDVVLITRAVDGHEQRTDPGDYADPSERLLCQALYDADKFRFGPDIFCTTMWLFCDYTSWSLAEMAGQFPKGISVAKTIVPTLRTDIGRSYGSELIEQGIKLGEIMHRRLIECSKKEG